MSRFGLFSCGGFDYAIPLARLLCVHQGACSYLLPKLPVAVTGVLVEKGELVPVLSLAELLQLNQSVEEEAEYQVLVETEAGTIALCAEQSCGIVAEPKGRQAAVEAQTPGLTGEFHFQDRIFQILDIDYLALGLTQGSW